MDGIELENGSGVIDLEGSGIILLEIQTPEVVPNLSISIGIYLGLGA